MNKKLGNPLRVLSGVREIMEPRMRMRAFNRDRRTRTSRYARAGFGFQDQSAVAATIERDGCSILPGAFDTRVLLEIRQQVERHLDAGTSLKPASKDSARARGDRSAPTVFFAPDEMRKGQQFFRQHTNYVSIADPLVSCPAVSKVAFHPLMIDIARAYLDCVPALGGLNLRKSYSNDLPEFDTLFFHVDKNSQRFLKFFFYLNDVDMDGGPFCYVRGSLRRRFGGWMSKGRWTLEEMEREYGKDSVAYLTAKVGDVLMADTNGFHRGTKIRGADRTMLTLDYVVHEEFEGTGDKQFGLPRSVYDSLGARERAVADFLQVV
ncbi:MAG: hypothetical protein EXR93_00100 [Gemmatimonadetes bacterium]|nr:hypothetical protein [Gemmatimonadota bacterium]